MSRGQTIVRLATLALASGLLGTTAAVRPVFLPLAVLGPIALWWRYDRLRRALLGGWIPALWAGLAVQTTTTDAHPSPGRYVVVASLATAAGLLLGTQLLRLRLWITDRLPHGYRAMLRIAEDGPEALHTLYPQGGHILARGEGGRGLVVGRPGAHTLALGPPSSRDPTSSLFIPNVMAWTSGAVVAVTRDAAVLDAAGPLRARLGQVHVLDVLGLLEGRRLPAAVHRVRWTPLRGCGDWSTARARAAALLGPARTTASVGEAGHWATQGERLLAPLLHAAAGCGLGLREVTSWVANPDQLEEVLGLLHELEATTKVVFPGLAAADTLRQLELLCGNRWIPRVTPAMSATGSRRDRRRRTTAAAGEQLVYWTVATLYDMAPSSCLVLRPDWPHPCLQPQGRAHLTPPFALWHRMPWPVEEGDVIIAGRRAVDPLAPSVPAPPPR